ncbi:MAG: phytanoyl-CoA dioxygenase family protein [Chloroflexota bacterium]
MMNITQLRDHFQQEGYTIAQSLFPLEETIAYRDHYMQLREAGSYPNDLINQWDEGETDPLKRYPRLFNMHRWDETSRDWLLHDRLRHCLNGILGRDPYAIQTMLYFKPPGSRGQALHQDQYYLRAHPGTSIAAWMALEDIDEDNGCLQMVPGTQDSPLICPVTANEDESFTTIVVPLPDSLKPIPIRMAPGDVLFFNGQIVHGSFPNTTQDRFRRSLVGHYVEGQAEQVAEFDHPVLRMDGTVVADMGVSPDGGECGVWVDEDGAGLVDVTQIYESGQLETTPITRA